MTQSEVLEKLSKGKITPSEASKLLDAIPRNGGGGNLYCKVSRKGAISLYGLQRMPITLYAEQWERLLKGAPEEHIVLAFIREWEGKDFHGEAAAEKGGKKEKYTARITRKAA